MWWLVNGVVVVSGCRVVGVSSVCRVCVLLVWVFRLLLLVCRIVLSILLVFIEGSWFGLLSSISWVLEVIVLISLVINGRLIIDVLLIIIMLNGSGLLWWWWKCGELGIMLSR